MCRGELVFVEELGPYGRFIDACMVKLVKEYNSGKVGVCVGNGQVIKTLACCCGHGIYPMTLVVEVKGCKPYEVFSRESIPRRRNLYKKDSNGIYFIPETIAK